MEGLREADKRSRDLRARTWKPRPVLSLLAGAVLLFGPIAMAWLVVRIAGGSFYQPPGTSGLLIWIAQAVAVSSAVTVVIHRIAERLSPLTVLLKLTLVFPDHAPSRFATALRIGNMNRVVREAAPLSGSLNDAAVRAVELVVALTHHDRRTRGHTERVRAYGEMIAEEIGIEGEELNRFRWGLLLHDIGKLAVPDEILNKSSELTDAEWETLRNHPSAGATMVEPLRPWLGEHVNAAGEHHEKWDGSGYPLGLAGTNISLIGRVCAVADAYDVITSRRSYKVAMSADHARSELVEAAGTHFDPVVVRTFLRLGLRRKPTLGFLGWVLEVPAIGTVIAASITTPSVAAAASAVTLSLAAIVGPSAAPDAIAFSPQDEVGKIETPPSTSAPASSVPPSSAPPASAPPSTIVPYVILPTTSTTTAPLPIPSPALIVEPALATTTTTTPVSAPTGAAPALAPTLVSAPGTTTTTVLVRQEPTSTTAAPTPTSPTTTTAPTTTTPTTTTPTTTTPTTTAPTTTTTSVTNDLTVEGNGFVLVEGADIPDSLAAGAATGEQGLVFLEQDTVVLTDALDVSLAGSALRLSGESASASIGEGTAICSYLYHFDPGERATTRVVMQFPGEVLGHTTNADSLARSNEFAADGVDYAWSSNAGVLVDDYISVDGQTVTFDFSVQNGRNNRDQVRIFTECGS